MKKRKHAEQRVPRADISPSEYSPHFAHEIRVREHHPFGISGGARGVEQRSKVIIFGGGRNKFSRPCRKDAVEINLRRDSRSLLSARAKPGTPCRVDTLVRIWQVEANN